LEQFSAELVLFGQARGLLALPTFDLDKPPGKRVRVEHDGRFVTRDEKVHPSLLIQGVRTAGLFVRRNREEPQPSVNVLGQLCGKIDIHSAQVEIDGVLRLHPL